MIGGKWESTKFNKFSKKKPKKKGDPGEEAGDLLDGEEMFPFYSGWWHHVGKAQRTKSIQQIQIGKDLQEGKTQLNPARLPSNGARPAAILGRSGYSPGAPKRIRKKTIIKKKVPPIPLISSNPFWPSWDAQSRGDGEDSQV